MHIKARNAIIPVIALGFLALGAMPTQDASKGLALRVQVLETKIQEMQGFMDAQRKAANEMLASVNAAEQAGFTAGINPRSREILVSAWKAQAKASMGGGKAKGAKDAKGDRDKEKRGTRR